MIPARRNRPGDYFVLKFTAVKGQYYSNFKSEDFEA